MPKAATAPVSTKDRRDDADNADDADADDDDDGGDAGSSFAVAAAVENALALSPELGPGRRVGFAMSS